MFKSTGFVSYLLCEIELGRGWWFVQVLTLLSYISQLAASLVGTSPDPEVFHEMRGGGN